ncbi:MAG: methyltransferase family protein [Candidatus Hodarchaeales archaeon]|jgi:protein-S-isoprenylcysteine O-methyltransferase Ste14
MQSFQFLVRKIIGFVFIVIYYNVILVLLTPTIFNDGLVIFAFLIFYVYMFIEQIYKLEPPEGYKIQRGDVVIIVIFLIYPLLLVLSFYERETLIMDLFPIWNHELVKYASIGLLIIGTIITFLSRLQLGKFGTTYIIVEEDHQLVTSGVYSYIRNPIYLGSITLFTSLGIAVGSLIVTSLTFLSWMTLMQDRINQEEQLLEEKFGEKYAEYKKRTKRLIPFLY